MDNLHGEHRERMRKRFREQGLDGFSDHEVLEFILFFGIPRKNTNEIAHRLLNRFGSLSGAIDADITELVQLNGIGETTATLIKFLAAFVRRYQMDRERERESYSNMDSVGRYLINHYIGATREHVELLLFDAGMHMIDHITLHDGSVNSSDINPDRIAEIVFTHRASYFVLAHNHPNGRCFPSKEDVEITNRISSAFEPFSIKMLEHFIVSGGEYVRLMASSDF